VETHPEFRRRGICGTLVYESARHALGSLGAERLVMVADAHYHAARIYESLGFRPTERQLGVERRPRD
jgi:predicted GNAT family acetyltransferase